mmetsp:Transcript_18226/g.53264  ORF Transcript_18226/g.53264 Transcript_18226/m.53264 type:complete len:278 (-) Transcript_18226:229-1062(-)
MPRSALKGRETRSGGALQRGREVEAPSSSASCQPKSGWQASMGRARSSLDSACPSSGSFRETEKLPQATRNSFSPKETSIREVTSRPSSRLQWNGATVGAESCGELTPSHRRSPRAPVSAAARMACPGSTVPEAERKLACLSAAMSRVSTWREKCRSARPSGAGDGGRRSFAKQDWASGVTRSAASVEGARKEIDRAGPLEKERRVARGRLIEALATSPASRSSVSTGSVVDGWTSRDSQGPSLSRTLVFPLSPGAQGRWPPSSRDKAAVPNVIFAE